MTMINSLLLKIFGYPDNMKTRTFFLIMLIGIGCSYMQSCMPVKEYQKQYLNDAEMQLGARKSEKFENNFQSYREGASGANGGKTGGGCGCN
jgi:uncharacterized protein DUF4266